MSGEHFEIEIASIGQVQTNPAGNMNASHTDATVPSIMQTNSVDSDNVSVTDVNVNTDILELVAWKS